MLAALAVSEMAHACLWVIGPTAELIPYPVAACTNNNLSTTLYFPLHSSVPRFCITYMGGLGFPH